MGKKKKECKVSTIGGQAVIEGVMMRGKTAMATAVRDNDGIIRVESKRLEKDKKGGKVLRLPLIRGVVSFFDSLVSGTKTLMRSAEVFGEGEPSKFEKWVSKKLKIDIMKVVISISLLLGLALAVFLFMWLPQTCRVLLQRAFGFPEEIGFGVWGNSLIEGGLKLLIFILYILLATIIKDVRRVFMYHGAEHKTISCYEKGLPLTVENAKKCTRIHDRCGTSFMVFVMLISIIVFACTEALIGQSVQKLLRVLLKIALLPVVAALSYELLKGLAKTNCFIVYPFKIPGKLLQRITTKEPTDEMIEVAITAFNTVMQMEADESVKEQQFIMPKKLRELLIAVKRKLRSNGINESAEAEWIVSLTLGIKRDELNSDRLVFAKHQDIINKIVDERITGRPLWYCIGDTDFYGYTIKVDERVLIPRPETELLVENAIKCIKNEEKVLDLCTGSGAIAITIKKEKPNCSVTAVDYSEGALALAEENAKLNDADVEFIHSDMFSGLEGKKFDIIISNPPYIKSQDILELQTEVKDFEPMMALDGGQDGLDFYKIIAQECTKYLTENGILLLECGIGQAEQIKQMLTQFTSVEILKDYENIDRMIKAVL